MTDIAGNIAEIKRRIADAARRAGRDPSEITLIAVSKTVDEKLALEAVEAGVIDLGESRVQEARRKFDTIGSGARWHMIGPLQTNKVKYCAGLFSLIHSVDRLELVNEINRRAEAAGVVMDCLLEVNISGEEQKSGCDPKEAVDILKAASGMRGLRMRGLMTVPPYYDDAERARPIFRSLIELRGDLNGVGIENVNLDIISAGMTHDFEVAIEEGSTMVRIGTAIFGERI